MFIPSEDTEELACAIVQQVDLAIRRYRFHREHVRRRILRQKHGSSPFLFLAAVLEQDSHPVQYLSPRFDDLWTVGCMRGICACSLLEFFNERTALASKEN